MFDSLSDRALNQVVQVALGADPWRQSQGLCSWLASAGVTEQVQRLRQRRGDPAPTEITVLPELSAEQLAVAGETALALAVAASDAVMAADFDAHALGNEVAAFFRELTALLLELGQGPAVRPS